MFATNPTDALVAGAGPVGLTAALTLAQRGLSIELLDEEPRPAAQSYALALHPGSLEILDHIHLLGDVLRCGHPVRRIAFYNSTGRVGELSLDQFSADYPSVVVIGQDTLERLLVEKLRHLGTQVLWNHRLSAIDQHEQNVTTAVDELDVSGGGYATYTTDWAIERSFCHDTSYVIGADGHNSCLRRALGIDNPEVAPPQLYAIFEFATGENLDDEVRIILGDGFTDVIWPLGENRCRWSFQLHDNQWGDDSRNKQRLAVFIGGSAYPHLTLDDLRKLSHDRAPWFDGWIGELRWAVMVRFEQRLAERFGTGRCWLAGDAAHLAAPVGVQSMNVGLSEAHELATRIAHAIRDRRPPAVLDGYNTERLSQWRKLLCLDGNPVALDSAPDWVRGHERQILSALPASGQLLSRMLLELGIAEQSMQPV